MEITLDDVQFDIEAMTSQTYGNITIVPIKTVSTVSQDILTLKKGLDMGIVIVEECNPSTVNKVKVTNKAVTDYRSHAEPHNQHNNPCSAKDNNRSISKLHRAGKMALS